MFPHFFFAFVSYFVLHRLRLCLSRELSIKINSFVNSLIVYWIAVFFASLWKYDGRTDELPNWGWRREADLGVLPS